jgi:hypothetical protein
LSIASQASSEDLPEWLLFSPSSSEGRSPALGRLFVALPTHSFAEVVQGKGKAPMEASGSRFSDHKGKAPLNPFGAEPPLPPHQPTAGPRRRPASQVGAVPGGFMADVCHANHQSLTSEQWKLVARRKHWHRIARLAPPPTPHCPVLTYLVGRCFNYLHADHREGHQTRACKRLRSSDATGAPSRPHHPMFVVIDLRAGDIALAKQASKQDQRPFGPAGGVALRSKSSGSSTL